MPEYPRSTDKVHKVKLPSQITHARWGLKQVSSGEKIPVEVYTHFVGEGSEIKVIVRNKLGGKLDLLTSKVYKN